MNGLDRSSVVELQRWSPNEGVLSVCLGIDPADRGEGWRVELRNGLGGVRDNAASPALRASIEATAERILARFPREAPHPEGRTHIGFVEVSRKPGREVWHHFQTGRPAHAPTVIHGRHPLLWPLLALLEIGASRGVALVSGERVRLLEWTAGRTTEIDDWEITLFSGDWRERKARRPRDPSRAQGTTASGHDQFEQRLDANREQFLREVAQATMVEMRAREWRDLIVLGDEKHGGGFVDVLDVPQDHVHFEAHNAINEGRQQIERLLDELTSTIDSERELRLVRSAAASAGARQGSGSLGLEPTLDALARGRVEHLVVDLARDYASGSASEGTDEDKLSTTERMIELALTTDAQVTPVAGEAAELLSRHGGVAALLRY